MNEIHYCWGLGLLDKNAILIVGDCMEEFRKACRLFLFLYNE